MISNIKLENIFVIFAIMFGFLYCFILPPFQSVDEGNHFYRTFQITEGKLIAKNIGGKIGDVLPKSLSAFHSSYFYLIKNVHEKSSIKNFQNDFRRKLAPEKVQYTEFANTALYSPVCYLTQVPAVFLTKNLDCSLGVIYYAGRICNLLFYCLLVYYSIRIIPFYKLPLLVVALFPMSLSLASSYSSDIMVMGLNFLWVAVILKLMSKKDFRSNNVTKYKILLFILAVLLAFTKSYILLLPLIFLLPTTIFKTKANWIVYITSTVIIAILALILWSIWIKDLSFAMNEVADTYRQIEFIKNNPLEYILVLVKTFIVKTPRILITMIGVLGWQDTRLDWLIYIAYPLMLYFAIMSDKTSFILQKWQKMAIIGMLLLGTLIIYTSLYLMWSSVGNPIIIGLNGKYFIPMVLPFLLLFKRNEAKYDYDAIKNITIILIFAFLFSTELSLLHRFYNLTPNLYYQVF